MKRWNPLWMILLVIVLALAACTPPVNEPGAAPEATETAELPTGEPEDAQPEAVVAARQHLADEQGLDVSAIEVLSYEAAEWPNSCLGWADADEMCAQAITPGYMVVLQTADRVYEVRTNESGTNVRMLEAAAPATEHPAAALAARQELATQLGVEAPAIDIVSSERQEWTDSCLGLGGPAESCLQAITPGWLVMLTYEGQSYEVHTDEQANAIRIAGGMVEPITDKPVGEPVISFSRSGGMAGAVLEYRIYENGLVEIAQNTEMPDATVETVNIEPPAVDLLVSSLEQLGFFEAGDASYVPEDTCCDRYLYELSVRQESGETTTIEVLESTPDTPEAVLQIIDMMQQFVESELATQ